MTIELKLPELGENIKAGKVIAVLVNVGETIAVDQSVIEVETDKALIEVPSSVEGIITEIHLKPGDDAEVGETILVIEESSAVTELVLDEETVEEASSETAEPPAASESQPMLIDDSPEPSETKAEDSAALESAPSGYSLEPSEAPAPKTPETPAPQSKTEPAPAAPSVRRIAREADVDIRDVPGSGIAGRISAEDVRKFVAAQGGAAVPGTPAPALMRVPVQLPDLARWGEIERAPMSGIRRATSVNLARAWTNIPHVTQCEKADISELDSLRKKFAAKAEAAGGKLTLTAHSHKSHRLRPQGLPAIQRERRCGGRGDRLQKLYSRRRRRGYRKRFARSGDSRCGQEEHRRTIGGTGGCGRTRPLPKTRPGRHAGRLHHHHEPRRLWRHVFHPR